MSETPATSKPRRKLPKADEPIAIVGIACRLPGNVDSPDDLWNILTNGQPIFTPAPNQRWNTKIPEAPADTTPSDASQTTNPKKLPRGAYLSDDQLELFDPEFFHLTDAEVLDMDPHMRLSLVVCAEALRNAGIRKAENADGGANGTDASSSSSSSSSTNAYWDEKERVIKDESADIGVFVGIGVAAADAATIALQNPPTPYTNFGYLPFTIANRVSHCLGLRGPSLNIDTACSGSLTAVHYACSSILSGESDTAIAAGVNIITNPSSYQHIDLLRILSPTYHSPILTPHVTGYTRGEAAIALVLKRLSKAQEDGDRIVGLLRGTAACHNGRTGRHMATPSLEGQSRVIMEAMDRAGLESNEINYVELHATGTQAGDKRELQTVMNVYGSVPRKEPVLISGIKSLYGHSEAASGITSLLKALLALRHRAVPPIVHFTTPRTDVDLPPSQIKIVPGHGLTPLPPTGPIRAGVNSFGAGGTNAHAVLESSEDDQGELGYPKYEYNLKRLTMIQQRGSYYKTEQVLKWEATV